MDKFIVTFARGFGTGGKAIASQLAKDLGIHCYEMRKCVKQVVLPAS